MRKIFLALIFVLMWIDCQTTLVQAQQEQIDLERSIFDQLFISVASGKKAMSIRESPGIVSVITREEIENSGARDLMDVLRLVPGFHLISDVQNFAGLGLRGCMGTTVEGRVAVFVDEHEYNEMLYYTVPMGNHFSVDQIEKIEIIRGPGAAIYGRSAEFAVIKITTRGISLNGGVVSATYGQMEKDRGRTGTSVTWGHNSKDFHFDVSIFVGEALRSDKKYTDMYGTSIPMAGNFDSNTINLNTGFNYKNFEFRYLFDAYHMMQQDYYDRVLSKAVPQDFNYQFYRVQYTFEINNQIKLIPRIKYTHEVPWKTTSPEIVGEYGNRTVERLLGSLDLEYNPSQDLNIICGIEYWRDKGESDLKYLVQGSGYGSGTDLFPNPDWDPNDPLSPEKTAKVNYKNMAAYLQGIKKMDFATVTLGFREDYEKGSGMKNFVPRAGLTKVMDPWHFKLLGSKSFRIPGISQHAIYVHAETTVVWEFETGYKFFDGALFTINFYDMTLKDPFYWQINQGYINGKGIGTRGVEMEFHYEMAKTTLVLNYAYYTTLGKTMEPDLTPYSSTIQNPEDVNANLGLPQHQASMIYNYKIHPNLNLNISANFYGKKYGYYRYDQDSWLFVLNTYTEDPVINVFFKYNDLFIKNFNAGIGVYNILSSEENFITPYVGGWHPPLPGPSREAILKCSYSF